MKAMYVYFGSKRNGFMVVETNLPWAIEYWTKRKRVHPSINWEIH